MSPVEGWYPDPAGDESLERYWDGSAWTSMTRPIAEVAPPPPPPPPAPGPGPAPAAPIGGAVPPPPPPGPADASFATPGLDPLPPAPGPGPGMMAETQFPEAQLPETQFPEAQLPEAQLPETLLPEAETQFPEVQPLDLEPVETQFPAADQPTVPPAPMAAAAPAAPSPSSGPSTTSASFGGSGVGGISTELLSDERFAEVQSDERVVRQNSRLLKVRLGQDVLAKQGSMVAFQGQIDFDHEGSGAAKFLKKAVTGEGMPLMRCSGQGELFLADSGYQVHIIHLEGAGLTVNGRNVLAFEPSLSWDIERIKGGAMMAGGLFNTRIEGHGWVAITTDGEPVVLRTDQPTFADTDAAVAWSSSLTTTLNRSVKAQALIGRGSGEAVQLAFQGQGIVIVQPSEGGSVPPHTH